MAFVVEVVAEVTLHQRGRCRGRSAGSISAALVELKLPVISACRSGSMILLWAMACDRSIQTGTPVLSRKVTAEYLAVALL